MKDMKKDMKDMKDMNDLTSIENQGFKIVAVGAVLDSPPMHGDYKFEIKDSGTETEVNLGGGLIQDVQCRGVEDGSDTVYDITAYKRVLEVNDAGVFSESTRQVSVKLRFRNKDKREVELKEILVSERNKERIALLVLRTRSLFEN